MSYTSIARKVAAFALAATVAFGAVSAVTTSQASAATSSPTTGKAPVIRVYNQYTGEHLFTIDAAEAKACVDAGWTNEGDAVFYVSTTKTDACPVAVYRLYNQYSGDHLYTIDKAEYDGLVKIGWTGENVAFYTPEKGIDVFRLFNQYVTIGTHHYTTSADEVAECVTAGWTDEKTAFFCL